LELVSALNDQAVDSIMLAKSISQVLRDRIVGDKAESADFNLLKNLVEIPASLQPTETLEITLLEAAYPDNAVAVASVKSDSPVETVAVKEAKATSKKKEAGPVPPTKFSIDKWDLVLEDVKNQAASLYTALRLATPTLEDSTLYLYFEFPLHQKKLNQAANKNIILSTVEKMTGQSIDIQCLIQEKSPKKVLADQPAHKDEGELTTISNIFGNAEVLESS
jgi:hypothetical protein